jgi:dihydroorotase
MGDSFDWLIINGRVIDPAQEIDEISRLGIRDGRIAAMASDLEVDQAHQVFDATGLLITPGLVDLHIHGYQHVTPLGVDVDHYCLGRGVTTAVDAGSAGCDTFPGFRAFAAERTRTRLLAFLHISRAGLAFSSRTGGDDAGELETPKLLHTGDCLACIDTNRDLIVGVKIRLSASIADNGRYEALAYDRAREAARNAELPLMTHHNFSSVELEDCPGKLKPGDIYTHCFHAYPSTILNPTDQSVFECVKRAKENGVLFDIGHGMGSFSWPVAEACISSEFLPDIISTDIHTLNQEGPVYDLPTVMSRLLHVGMSLTDVVRASTTTPARAIGWDDRIGSLQIGREADIAALKLSASPIELEDCHAQLRPLKQRLIPQAVWRAGERAEITAPEALPNTSSYPEAIAWKNKLVISDPTQIPKP